MSKREKIFIPIYIAFLIFGGFYVRHVLKTKTVSVKEKSQEETVKQRYVNVDLNVIYPYSTNSFRIELKNINSAEDLLEKARDDYNLVYEKTNYSDRVEISSVNGVQSNWRLFLNEVDITNDMNNVSLEEDQVFVLKQL